MHGSRRDLLEEASPAAVPSFRDGQQNVEGFLGRGAYDARFAHFSGRFDSFSAESRINVERKVQQRQKALLQC
jgi:hypothetical protein